MLRLVPKPYRKWKDQVGEEVALSSYYPQAQQRTADPYVQERWDGTAIIPPHKYEIERSFPATFENPYPFDYMNTSRDEMNSRFNYDSRDSQDYLNMGFAKGAIATEKQTRLEASLSQGYANAISEKYLQPITRTKPNIAIVNDGPITRKQEAFGRPDEDAINSNKITAEGRRFEQIQDAPVFKNRFLMLHGPFKTSGYEGYSNSVSQRTNGNEMHVTPNDNVWLSREMRYVPSMHQDYDNQLVAKMTRRREYQNSRRPNPSGHDTYITRTEQGTVRDAKQKRAFPENLNVRNSGVPTEQTKRMTTGQEDRPSLKYETDGVRMNARLGWSNRQTAYLSLRDTKKQSFDEKYFRPPVFGTNADEEHLLFADAVSSTYMS